MFSELVLVFIPVIQSPSLSVEETTLECAGQLDSIAYQGAHCTDPIMVLKRLLLMVPMFLVLVLHMAAVHDNTFIAGASKTKNTYPTASSVAQRGLLFAQINYHVIRTV